MLFPLFGLPKFCRQGNREKGVGRGDFRWLGIVVSTTLLSNHLMTTREEAMETLEKEQAGHVDSVFSLCVGSLLTDDLQLLCLRLHTDTHTHTRVLVELREAASKRFHSVAVGRCIFVHFCRLERMK